MDQRIDSILECVQHAMQNVGAMGVYSSQSPLIRIVSSLAEGADRIVAHRALLKGFELQCPLPFHRDEYEKDFSTCESKQTYRGFLRQATSVFELDGAREPGQHPYQIVGRLLITQCDVLIAIWDGKEAAGPGGTGEVVEEAMKLGMPVVRIDSCAPHEITFDKSETWLRAFEHGVRRVLLPGNFAGKERGKRDRGIPKAEGDLQEKYFREKRRWWRSPFYKLFESLMSKGSLNVSWRLPKGESLDDPAVYAHFDWATSLSVFYAELSRSAILLSHLLACLAVLSAVLPLTYHIKPHEGWFIGLELFCITIIALIVRLGVRYRWHERWLAYRMLAEQLRVLDYLAMLARTLPVFRPPVHLDNPDSGLAWVNWHFRAIVREIGLKAGKVTAEYLNETACKLRLVIVSQGDFHAATANRCHTVQRRLHFVGGLLFLFTALACMAHFGVDEMRQYEWLSAWLIVAAAALPALGAALAGILGHAEFERVGGRSLAMSKGLKSVAGRLDEAAEKNDFTALSEIAAEAARIMTAEVQDWHVLFKGRPIELPS